MGINVLLKKVKLRWQKVFQTAENSKTCKAICVGSSEQKRPWHPSQCIRGPPAKKELAIQPWPDTLNDCSKETGALKFSQDL